MYLLRTIFLAIESLLQAGLHTFLEVDVKFIVGLILPNTLTNVKRFLSLKTQPLQKVVFVSGLFLIVQAILYSIIT
jgi:hypothetical protein